MTIVNEKQNNVVEWGAAQNKALMDILGKDVHVLPRELLTRPSPNDNSEDDNESRHISFKN